VEFLANHFEIPKTTATKVYPNAIDILTLDGQISEEKLRQILDMMQDTGQKEPLALRPASLMDFSFLRASQQEIAASGGSKNR
jgi:hypothetical protein